MTTDTTELSNNKSIHEFTKWDLSIDTTIVMKDVSPAAHDEITEAYHALARTIARHSNDFDVIRTSIGSTFRQHMVCEGPF